VLQGLRRLDEQQQQLRQEVTRKRARKDDDHGEGVAASLKRLKDLEAAVAYSDNDTALFYELCKEHETHASFAEVVLPHVRPCADPGRVNGAKLAHPGPHLHRLNAVMLRMRSDVINHALGELKAALAKQEGEVKALRSERLWQTAGHKDTQQRLAAKTETLKRLYEENDALKGERSSADAQTERYEVAKLKAELKAAHENTMKALKQQRDAETKLKKQHTTLAGAHQQRMHEARNAAIVALDAGHVALTAELEKQLVALGIDREKLNALRVALVPHAEAMRTALGQHLI